MYRRLVLAVSLVGICAAVGFRQADQSTPEATVKAFAAAIQAVDIRGAARLVKGGKPDANFSPMIEQLREQTFKLELLDLKSDVKGDKATVSYNLQITTTGETPQSVAETLQLERTQNVWLIVPPAQVGGRAVLAGLAAMTVDPERVIEEAKRAAMGAACLSNVKQICLGFMMLATDNDDVFKAKADRWKSAVMPYIKNEKIFHCPADPSGAVSYSVNPAILSKAQTAMQDPANTVLLYEGKKGTLVFRHQNRAAVGYCDGHVKLVNRDEAKKLRWKP